MGDTSNWTKGKGYPQLLISAGKGMLTDLGTKYIKAADPPKKQIIIGAARHGFDDSDEVMQQLFSATAKWLKSAL
jgi:hypothetical protein